MLDWVMKAPRCVTLDIGDALTPGQQQNRAARDAMLAASAKRAVDDPVKLARSVRTVKAALAQGRITLADLGVDSDAALGQRHRRADHQS